MGQDDSGGGHSFVGGSRDEEKVTCRKAAGAEDLS